MDYGSGHENSANEKKRRLDQDPRCDRNVTRPKEECAAGVTLGKLSMITTAYIVRDAIKPFIVEYMTFNYK